MRTLWLLGALALAACGNAGGHDAGYDASRDAAADIRAAVGEAKTSGKRVLVEAGGNWCSWCRTMHRFYDEHPALTALRDKNFTTVRVNVEAGAPLPSALAGFPAPTGFPHLYVLDAYGSVVQSQDTSALEAGQSYDLEKFTAFLTAFAPPKP